MIWERSAFVATPGNVPLSLVPDYTIQRLWVQIASGCGPPGAPLTDARLAEMRALFYVGAWVWCVGLPSPEEEATYAGALAKEMGFDALIVNIEEHYDGHGDQSDPRFSYPRRYLSVLDWDGPLGVTTTPLFGSDMTDWQARGAIYMPQSFPLENGVGLTQTISHGIDWGWKLEQIRPLVQCYMTNGQRPNPITLNSEAAGLGIGVIPYVIEQACDPNGIDWINTMAPAITRPQPQPEEAPDLATIIGSQHGITAACNRLRYLDPKGTKLGQTDGKWNDLSTLGPDVNTFGAWDKLERSLKILCADHDAAAS